MITFKVVSVTRQNLAEVDRFLRSVYHQAHADFLGQHRNWWYRNTSHHLAVTTEDGEVVAHTAMIPSCCLMGKREQEVLWWVDLIVAPQHRGQGLQTLLDQRVQAASELKFAYPARELSARMFHKHGWEVRPNSFQLTLPLQLTSFSRVRNARGAKTILARLLTWCSSPLARLLRAYLSHYQSVTARAIDSPDPNLLAEVFRRYNYGSNVIMTHRNAEFIRWRYLEAPYIDQLTFYVAGALEAPSQVAITRTLNLAGVKITRILDVFGNLNDRAGLRDILRLAVRDAARRDSAQIVAIASSPTLVACLRSLGFLFSQTLLFCWHTEDPALDQLLNDSPCHWTFADSDCDNQ